MFIIMPGRDLSPTHSITNRKLLSSETFRLLFHILKIFFVYFLSIASSVYYEYDMGHGGALVESIAFNRRVVGSTSALAAMYI